MTPETVGEQLLRAATMLQTEPVALDDQVIRDHVSSILTRREEYLELVSRHGSPLYVLDCEVLRARAERFVSAFARQLPTPPNVFYAMKSNNHPQVAATLLESGLGLDVSSGWELQRAIEQDARNIIFSGPGKTDAELAMALDYADRVTLLIDSMGELERVAGLAANASTTIRCGVRLNTDPQGPWRKFGIAREELEPFITRANQCPNLALCGLQFHLSWNLSPERQAAMVRSLEPLLLSLPESQRRQLTFLDIGGGYWPEPGEWLQWAGTDQGGLIEHLNPGTTRGRQRFVVPSEPIETFAEVLCREIRTHLLPHADLQIYLEPGRWLCHPCMHLVMTVVDRKRDDLTITDAGTNAIGWERFEVDFSPVINLTDPSLEERDGEIQGCLCTPRDVWGYSCWGGDLRPGDVLLVPNQGAYTYSLRQNFIKALPEVVTLK